MSAAAPRTSHLALLLRHRWWPILASLVCGVATLVYVLLAPKWYEAQLAVMPTESSGAAGLAGLMMELPGGFDIGGGGTQSDAERIAAVLSSRSVTDAVIQKFDLMTRWELPYLEKARDYLWSVCEVRVVKKPRLVTLTCEEKDPELVRAMVAYFGEIGNETFRRVEASSSTEQRKFLEQRVSEALAAVDEASRQLRTFEEDNAIVEIAEQGKAVVSSMASLRGEILSKRLDLGYLQTFASSDEPAVAQARRQISLMEAALRGLEGVMAPDPKEKPGKAPASAAPSDRYFPPASEVPELRYRLAHLEREREVRQAVYLLLMQRLEAAKANEAVEVSAFQILDEPALPTYRVWPKKWLVLIGLVVGALLGMGVVFGRQWLRQLRMQVEAERAQGG